VPVARVWRSPKNPKGLVPKTVRSIWRVRKLAFKFGVTWGYLNENPLEKSVSSGRAELFRLLDLLHSRAEEASRIQADCKKRPSRCSKLP
jgi:hypothetical protein